MAEPYDECSNPSNVDGTPVSSSSSPPNSSQINSNPSSSSLFNSQTQSNHQPTSLSCTVSKRPQKITNQDDSNIQNSLVQNSRQTAKMANGNDDELSASCKQQKKQAVKSSNTQNRRQQKKPETKESVRAVSRDSSSSHQNGFTTSATSDLVEIDKK